MNKFALILAVNHYNHMHKLKSLKEIVNKFYTANTKCMFTEWCVGVEIYPNSHTE